ncbi:hypothetical protein CAEBREN_16821 [Caenorhabditis brenneri]|uniref:Uncharacterized protein n=1 Tax=Caenorhabditis brenneri TaxID=135651 RepID=G0NKY0_CAEBE|nr:hypothetical protein CAEBREN_16821 [Caenorhabditis brenneri]
MANLTEREMAYIEKKFSTRCFTLMMLAGFSVVVWIACFYYYAKVTAHVPITANMSCPEHPDFYDNLFGITVDQDIINASHTVVIFSNALIAIRSYGTNPMTADFMNGIKQLMIAGVLANVFFLGHNIQQESESKQSVEYLSKDRKAYGYNYIWLQTHGIITCPLPTWIEDRLPQIVYRRYFSFVGIFVLFIIAFVYHDVHSLLAQYDQLKTRSSSKRRPIRRARPPLPVRPSISANGYCRKCHCNH